MTTKRKAESNGHSEQPTLNMEEIRFREKELIANALFSRTEFFRKLLDPRRDIDAECGYPEPTIQTYRDLYDREPIAARVVEVLPKESWQSQPSVYEDEDSEQVTEFEKAWDELAQTLRGESWYQDEEGSPIWEHLRRADIESGIGHYGIILLGLDDGKSLETPVEFVTKRESGETGISLDSSLLGTEAQYNRPLYDPIGTRRTGVTVNDCGTGSGGFKSGNSCAKGGNVEIHDPDTGEIFWRGGKVEAEQMLKEAADAGDTALKLREDTGLAIGIAHNKPKVSSTAVGKETVLPPPSNYQQFETGKPITATVYRGETTGGSGSGMAALGVGKYYALEPIVAERFSKKGSVSHSQVSLKNPVVIKSDADMRAIKQAAEASTGADLGRTGNLYEGYLHGNQPAVFTKYLKSIGHDGLITTFKEAPGGQQVLVFNRIVTTNLAPVFSSKKTKRKLLFVRSFDESLAQIIEYEADLTSPRFGQPVMYQVTLNDPRNNESTSSVGLTTATYKVHWTRVIHVADNLGTSEIFGIPRMQQVFNRLCDLRKLYGGSGEMYWRGAFPGLSVETNPQLGGDVTLDQAGLRAQMQDYMNGLQRYLALTGMSAKSLAPQVVDPTPQIKVQLESICILLGIPMRIFMGSERGELASGQDDSTWNGRLKDRQCNYLTPRMIIPFVDRLIMVGVLPEPDGYSVVWPDLDSLKPLEQATLAGTRTEALAKYVGGGIDALISPMDYLTRELGYNEEEAASILEATMETLEAQQEAQQEEQIKSQHGLDVQGNPLPGHPAQQAKLGQTVPPETEAVANEMWDYLVTNLGGKGFVTEGNRKAFFAQFGAAYARKTNPVQPASGTEQGRGAGGQFGKGGRTDDGVDDRKNRAKKAEEAPKPTTKHKAETDPGKFAVYKSGNAAEKDLASSSSQWSDGNEYHSNRAIKAYAGTSDSFLINNCARTNCKDKGLKAKSDDLAKTLDKASFPKDIQSSRSINPKTNGERQAILDKFIQNKGKSFVDNAFVSTTANAKYADEWATKFKSSVEPIKVSVLVPKGAKAAYIPKEIAGRQEWEVLIQRGSAFKVHSVEGSNVVLELE